MKIEKHCFMCKNVWESTDVQDVPYWGVYYTWCGVCVKRMMAEFEYQFRPKPTLRLVVSNGRNP